MKTKYIVVLTIVIVTGLIIYRLASNKKKIDEKNRPVQTSEVRIPVRVALVKEQLLEVNITKTGNLAPFKEAKVLAVTSGTIQQLRFQLGDHVTQGQVLAVTDTRTLQLQLQQSESRASKLRNDLEVYTELLRGKAATREKVDEIRQNYMDAVSQLNRDRKNLADAAVKAPTSGVISEKAVEQGVFVNSGAQIATIVNLSQAKVQVNLTETEVYQISVGQQVRITTDVYPGRIFKGKVSFISPQADQSYNYMVEIMIDNTGDAVLRSGTFVYADFSRKTEQNILVIPREALTESIKNPAVYVVENGVAHLRSVKTGSDFGGTVQITAGIKAGEHVVTSGQINLRDRSKVSITK